MRGENPLLSGVLLLTCSSERTVRAGNQEHFRGLSCLEVKGQVHFRSEVVP